MYQWVSSRFDDRLVVGAHHERSTEPVGAGQQDVDQVLPGGPVELAGRFVRQDEPWPLGEHPGDGDPLRLSTGEVFRQLVPGR